VLRLYYHAPDLQLDRPKMMPEKPDPAVYDCILTFDGSHLTRLYNEAGGVRKNITAQSW
jgi:hypothetical protein